MRRSFRKCLLYIGFATFLGAAACSDEGGDLPDLDGYATTPDEAVALYRTAFVRKDVDRLERILDPEFVYELHPDDADSLDISRTFPFGEALAMADRIFRDENGVRLDGTCQPPPDPVTGLRPDFSEAPLGEVTRWIAVNEGPLRGTLVREFGLTSQLLDANGLLDFIHGRQLIYVRQESVSVNGRCCASVWRIAGWQDLGVNSTYNKHGAYSWGRVLVRWRSNGPEPTGCNP